MNAILLGIILFGNIMVISLVLNLIYKEVNRMCNKNKGNASNG
jgi:hypothetical protein